ncbi:MAG: cyclic nucleotide-binding domain-containing protein [Cyclobacteriaceae bacterium]
MKANNALSAIDPSILDIGTEIRLKNGEIVSQQFSKSTHFYMLKSGRVKFYLSLDETMGEIEVGMSDKKLTPIGWSGFNAPGRYATTVKVDTSIATFIKWDHAQLMEVLSSNPELGRSFLKDICGRARLLYQVAVNYLSETGPKLLSTGKPTTDGYKIVEPSPEKDLIQFLRKSAFFETFDELPLEFIAQYVEGRLYPANETIFLQNQPSEGLFILGYGKVRFSSTSESGANISFRQINTPGFLVGWAGAVDMPNIINARAVQETMVYHISIENLQRILKRVPELAHSLYSRLLWLLSHQLQAVRTRIIAAKLNHEVFAIGNLIDQNSAKLSLDSVLHKVPHLLDNKLTVRDAIDMLEQLKESGSTLEKNIALTALDILEEIINEEKFYRGLVEVYNSAVKAPKDLPAPEVRKLNAKAYIKIFDTQKHIITGEENLPENPGNIFIYNHLRNDPYNTLPNQFQITLDSHFISSMILMRKYGIPGLRIVRVGLSKEFAHQEYYQRLGHIDVFTELSGKNPKKLKERAKKAFFHEAKNHLNNGGNLIISPEGNSYTTDESPGPFKAGAFNLALSMKKEPWIVPIAMANFEKRARNTRFSSLILPPFKVSEFIKDKESKEEMKSFLANYQNTFRGYVEQAQAQAE